MIHYQIDITEGSYQSYRDSVERIDDLRPLIYPDGAFVNCCGYLRTDAAPNVSLCVAAVREHGVFLGWRSEGRIYLSLHNRSKLSEVADVWGDGLDVSVKLFLPPEKAWRGMEEFADIGGRWREIRWIRETDIPEGGNYII